MNLKLTCLASLGFILFIVVGAQAQEVIVQGKVIDIGTGKGVKAVIRYKSLPTGGLNGRFNDSTYSFSTFGTAKYQVSAELPGYIPAVAIVNPEAAGGSGKIIRDLRLTPKEQTIRLTHLIFEQGKSIIDPESFSELDELAALLIDNPKLIIQLEGHTDNVGNAGANLKLSQQRVDAVKKYLAGKKISKKRLKTKAFGGTQPIATGNSPEARNLNRRVEIRILSQ